ncbi:tyrosinase family protein [Bosea sp. ASV33]|uniref:tyrosinase family protein n=1 Tax=Bosea sp. ASV33 TaxID=2795106 RepID=UPI0018EE1A38|nr:tyrosinase family protein [Bosea sp. ASV33]
MASVRRDVATLGKGWNDTLLHYAMAVRHLDNKPISERTSWKFLAAMHGFHRPWWVQANVISEADQIPPELEDGTYGDQCQHGSWYFLPWHRGYLAAFEAIVAATVKELTGAEWTLPYWNYLDPGNPAARDIPEPFVAEKMPDGSENPLRRYPRRLTDRLPNVSPQRFGLGAMAENDFLVSADGSIGFGGGEKPFDPGADASGDLEFNPHNSVHSMLGGFMGNPYFAGLDPLFWLHHCNIDRLWEAWMRTKGKTMTRDPRWLDGPTDRRFILPSVDGKDPGIYFSARDTLGGGKLHPTYDDLNKGTGVTPGAAMVATVGMGPPERQRVDSLGSNGEAVVLTGQAAVTTVRVDLAATKAAVTSMGVTAPGKETTRLYLKLEGIRGEAPTALLDVYVNLPVGADPASHEGLRAGSVDLFGLQRASRRGAGHGANGLSRALDITEIADRLRAAGDPVGADLRVTLVPVEGSSSDVPLTVDKVSLLKRTGVATPP